jgi:RNA polymerase-binding transcription factor DksA
MQSQVFRRVIMDRFDVLRGKIRDALLCSDNDSYRRLGRKVLYQREDAMMDLLKDICLTKIERDIGEIRNISKALLRMDEHRYGICVGCEKPISIERLRMYPVAKRCIKCQCGYAATKRRRRALIKRPHVHSISH